MIISIIQPCFVPWLGYFEQIALADIFVYLDDVKYTKQDWRNNNQLKSPNGLGKIYIPIQKTTERTQINDALISYNENWEQKLLNYISAWYIKAPYFIEISNLIKPVFQHKHERLVDLNYNLNKTILDFLEIKTPIYFASDIPKTTNDKNLRLLEICKNFENIDLFYDGKKAENFIDVELFKNNGITMCFQEYIQLPYKQLWGDFIPYTSVLDVLMNCGKEAKKIIMSNPMSNQLKEGRVL